VLIVDCDDLAEDARSLADLRRLDKLRAVIPTFKATLFTIGGRCSKGFIADIKASRPYLDLVPHGWMHQTNRECEQWNADTCREVLAASRIMGLTTRGFKAPGWQISDGCYQALLEEGYWVADMRYNDARRPFELNSYCLDSDGGPSAVIRMTNRLSDGWRIRQCIEIERHIHGHIRSRRRRGTGGSECIEIERHIHGHIGHLNGRNENALEIIAPHILAAAEHDTDFRFISEVME